MLRHAWNRLFALLAVGTTTLAVLVTIARLLLPQLGEHRADIERWLSDAMHQPVRIERLQAQWRGWTPSLELDGVELLDASGRRALTRLEHVSVTIAVLRSLARRELVPGRLGVSGVRLSLVRGTDGTVTIEGIAPSSPERPGSQQNALADWLLKRDDLSIDSAQLVWRDDRFLLRPVVFSNVALRIRREGEHRQIRGTAVLPAAVGRSLEFVLDAHGDLLTPRWHGEWYLRGRDIRPQLLLNLRDLLGVEVDEGRVGFEVWSEWRDARLTRVRGRFRAFGVGLALEQGRFDITGAGGALLAERMVERGWRIVLAGLTLDTRNGSWPETTMAMTIRPGADGGPPDVTAQASFLRLDDVAPLAANARVLPERLRQTLSQARPRGDIRDLRAGWHPRRPQRERFSLRAHLSDLITQPFGKVPGINALSGTIEADGTSGSLALAPRAVQVTAPRWLSRPLWLSRVTGTLGWRRAGDEWRVVLERLGVATDAAEVELGGRVAWTPGTAPTALLAMRVDGGDLSALPAMLPAGAIPERGRRWLTRALVGGRITGGAGILRGPLDRFPFEHGEGVFEMRFAVEDGLLDFSTRWPRAEDIAADVVFRGAGLTVEAASARLMGAALSTVTARIDHLGRRRKAVLLTGHATATAGAARRLIDATPLAHSVGRRLEAVELDGDLALDLELSLPLYPAPRSVAGTLRLDDVTVGGLGVTLAAVDGDITFDHRRWRGEGIHARYLDTPVTAAIAGSVRGGPVTVTLAGRGDGSLLMRTLRRTAPSFAEWLQARELPSRLSGEAAWRALLTLPEEGRRRSLEVVSDLAGVAIALPAPLGKKAGERLPLTVRVDSDPQDRMLLAVSAQGRVAASVRLGAPQQGRRHLAAAAVHFGAAETPPEAPPGGIRVTGELPPVRAADWLPLADSLSPAGGRALAVAADLRFALLDLWGQRLRGLTVRADFSPGELLAVHFEGEQASGSAELALDTDGAPLRAQLERLELAPPGPEAEGLDIDPARLPPLDVTVGRLRYGTVDLGRSLLRTRPASDGLVVESLEFADSDYSVTGSGAWLASDGVEQSRCHLDVHADELQALLARFGYPQQAITGGPVRLAIDAAWPGSPMQFALARLSGRLALEVGEGSLKEIEPNAGRLFGLLSIQSLTRRLTLDFQDLFGQGLSFDRITGEFELDGGNAYTQDLVVEGPSLRIQVSGRTGLAARDYDQTVIVTPQLSGSLPVASALFGPAGVAAGAALFLGQKVFKGLPERIDAIFARQYRVTGPWDDPVIERVRDTDVSLAD